MGNTESSKQKTCKTFTITCEWLFIIISEVDSTNYGI